MKIKIKTIVIDLTDEDITFIVRAITFSIIGFVIGLGIGVIIK